MEKWKRKQGSSEAAADTLAEIQARLDVCEEDLEQALGDTNAARRRASDVTDEAGEIGRLLEELMAPGETESGEMERAAPGTRDLGKPKETPGLDTLFHEEAQQAEQLSESEAARQRIARDTPPPGP